MARILIVDDEDALASALSQFLTGEGHQVSVCLSPAEAERAAVEGRPDLALIDYQMPGMSGVEVLARLRARPETRQLPVLFISGTEAVRFAGQIPPEPRVRFLLKPIALDVLHTMVGEMLDPNSWSSKG